MADISFLVFHDDRGYYRLEGTYRDRTRIPAKIYHKPIDPLYKAIEAVAVEARPGVRNA